MRKTLLLIAAAALTTMSANAQLLKKLGQAMDKVGQKIDKIAEGTTSTKKKPGEITYQEDALFVKSWGTMKLEAAVGKEVWDGENVQKRTVQIVVRINTNSGMNYAVRTNKVVVANGQQLEAGTQWTREDWKLVDEEQGIYVSPVITVPLDCDVIEQLTISTFLGDIYATIHNIQIKWMSA